MRPLLGILALLTSAVGLRAQTLPLERGTDTGTPVWMHAWSPLAPIADHPRLLPRAPTPPELLLAARPQIGLFWTAGNPAGLPFDVRDGRAELRVAGGADDGDYKRPLDDQEAGVLQFVGMAWQPVGRGAAAGHVIFDQERPAPSSFADVVEPYPSNPLVVTDTSLPDMRRVRARLEGALGLQFGGWSLGLSAGVEVRDNRSHKARFPRLARMSTPGVALGLARRLPFAGLRLSAHGRWVGDRESLTLVGRPGTGVVYQLEGYAEPTPREVVAPNLFYLRKMERNAFAGGLALSGTLWDANWVVFWELTTRDEKHYSEQKAHPAADRWTADGRVLGGAVQRAFFNDALLVTGYLRSTHLNGDATRFDLEGVIFRGEESVLLVGADVRYVPTGSPWMLGLVFTTFRESRRRRDFIAELRTEIESWTPGAAVEIARALGETTRVSLGYGVSYFSAVSTLPDPEPLGPQYQRLIAPELSFYATRAMATTASLAVRQDLGSRTALLVRGHRESLAGRDSEPSVPFAPTGERTLWNLSLSLLLGE